MKKIVISIVVLLVVGVGAFLFTPYKPSTDELNASYTIVDGKYEVSGTIFSGLYKFKSSDYEVKDGDVYISTSFKKIGSGYGSFDITIDDASVTENSKFFLVDSNGNTKEIEKE